MTAAFPGPASRADVAPFHVMEVLSAAAARQRTHGDVVTMCAGQPTAGAPKPVLAAAAEVLAGGDIGYTEQLGIPELRSAIAGHYRRSYGVAVSPDDVIVTTGSSGGFLLAFLAAFDAGARVAMARPGYPAYRNLLSALGCQVVEFPVGADTRFQPTASMLDELHRAQPLDGVIVASPSNPTGTMLSPGELAAIAGWCSSHGVQLISDEIYHGICYTERAATAWQTSTEAIVLGSFSKYFAMTGWRLGWMVLPPSLLRPVERLAQSLFISPPTLPQHGAMAAFDCREELDANVRRYAENRARLLEELPKAGFDRLAPSDGAFYLFADVGRLTNDSEAFCRRMLAETGVAMTPGRDFDPERGHRYLRISFAGSAADIDEALRRLIAWRR